MVGVEIDGWETCCGCVMLERCDRGYIDDMTVVAGVHGCQFVPPISYALCGVRCAGME